MNSETNQAPAGLYIHIPFCRGKCNYCHFYSTDDIKLIAPYIEALPHEMALYQAHFDAFDTVYLGGGTPSLLEVHQIEAVLHAVQTRFQILPAAEITVELNPADREINWLREIRQLGVNRLNIGVQSFDDALLKFLGRRHTPPEAITAIEAAAAAGFDNIGLDLMYAIPGQTPAVWQKTLAQALDFAPRHLSCYELSVEPGTPLALRHGKKDFVLPDEEQQWEFFRITSEYLENAGYIHYEVSNYAQGLSWASRHNQKYWNHTPYLGLGPAAHSFSAGTRWWNQSSVDRYIGDLINGKTPLAASERLTRDQLRLETLFLGLRTRRGIDLYRYHERYQEDLLTTKARVLHMLIHEGLLFIRDNRLQTTLKGLAIADRLAVLLSEGTDEALPAG